MKWICLSAFVLQSAIVIAATEQWQGTTNSMNTASNWVSNTVPTNGDDLIFTTSSIFSKSVLNNLAGGTLTIGDLTINDAYIFTGGTFVVPAGTHALSYGLSGSNINLGGVTLTGTWTVTGVGASPGNQIQAPITGVGNLTINGAYLLLTGTNNYSGTTTLGTGATLKAGSGTSISSASNFALSGNGSTFDISGVTAGAGFDSTIGTLTGVAASTIQLGNATLTVTNSGSITYPGLITTLSGYGGGFALHSTSTGTLTLTGNNNYSSQAHPGSTTVEGGTLTAGSANAFGTYSNLAVGTGATLNLNDFTSTFGTINGTGMSNMGGTITLGSGTITSASGGTFTGTISGTGGLTLGGGTFNLGTLSYTGQTQITGGAILVTNSLNTSSSLLFVTGGGTVQANTSGFSYSHSVTLSDVGTFNTNGQTITLSGPLSGPGAFTKTGTGILILDGSNGYTGATQVTAGTLQAGSSSTNAFGTNSFINLSSSTAVLDLNSKNNTIGSLQGAVGSSVTLGSATMTISEGSVDNAFYGVISGTGDLVAAGGTVTLMQSNTYTGSTTIQSGVTLNVLDLGDTTDLIFSTGGGNLEFGSTTTSSAPITINGPAQIGANTFEVTLSGDISGTAGQPFTKIGPGTLTLTGMNTLESQIAIEGGILNVNSDSLGSATSLLFDIFGGTLQAGDDLTIAIPITLSANGTIDTNGHSVICSDPITAGNPFTKAGVGTLTLTGANNYTGRTTIADGTLIASSTSLPIGSQIVFQGTGNSTFQASSAFTPMTSSIVLMAGGIFDVDMYDVTITGVVAGLTDHSFTKAGSGTLIFNGANIYTGPTNVTEGILQAGVATVGTTSGAFGVNSVVTVSAGATLALNNYNNTIQSLSGPSGSFVTLGSATLTINDGGTETFSGNISGTGGVTLVTGTQIFSGNNNYTGATTVSGGTLQAGSTSAFAPASHFVMSTGTTLALNNFNNTVGSLAGAGTTTLGSATLTIANGNAQTYSGNMSGTGGVTLTTGALTLSGTNAYSGATTINGGTLTAGSTGSLSNSSAFTVTGALSLNTFNSSVKSLAGAGTVSLGTATLTLANPSNTTFSGAISGTGGLTLTTGIQTLSGNNSYTGPTTVNSGTLQAGSTTAFGQTTITIASGGTLAFQTYANSVASITNSGNVSSSATITAATFTQNSGGITTLNFPTSSATPVGNVTTTGAINLNGTLAVTNTGMFAGTGEITLFQSSGTGKQLQGTFSSTTVPFGKITYDYSDNLVSLGAASNCDGTWNGTSNGNWAALVNWDSCIPGLNGMADDNDTATFPTVGASTITVTLADSAGSMAQDVTLHDLIFDSATTSYTIENFSGAGTIYLDAAAMSTKPKITVLQGDHTINATISLEQDSRFSLNEGSLTLGANSTIISIGTWNVSEGAGSGTLNNYGNIHPFDLLFEGNTINNHGIIHPTTTLEMSGLEGILVPVTVNNYLTLTSGSTFIVGDAGGPTIFNNYGTASSNSTFTIVSGTVTNFSGGTMTAAPTSTFSITGGTITNNSGATLGSSTANLSVTGGTLATSGSILADNYTQSSSSTFQSNVLSLTSFGKLTAAGTATLDGSLVVSALPNVTLTNGDQLELIATTGGRIGQFANVSFQNFPGSLIPSIVYLSDSVQLDIRQSNPAPTHGSSISLSFTSIGQHNSLLTQKSRQMRQRINKNRSSNEDTFTASNDIELFTPEASLAQQFNPEVKQKTQQLSDKAPQKPNRLYSFYIGPVASFGHVDSKGSQMGLGYTSAGALIGGDGLFEDRDENCSWTGWGAILEYRHSWATVNDNWGTSSFDRVHGSLYATVVPKSIPQLAFEGVAGFAFNWDTSQRKTGIDKELTATGKTNETIGDVLFGIEYTLSDSAYAWMPKNFSFVPLVTLQYIIDKIYGYDETGAGIYDLHISSHTPQSLTSVVGARFDYLFHPRSADFRLELDIGWQYEYLNRNLAIGLNAFNSTNVPTTITTVAPGRNSLLLALDLLGTTQDGWQTELNVSYQHNNLFYDVSFYLGFGRQF